ncbi:MAG: SRPBCC domain-containing protein [Proteobacteria bacterium]|nr:SRPBCC domain-containing protein [Pseudomonadota bacterium]
MTESTLKKTLFLNASRETVWTFLTDKDKLGDWYHPAEKNLAEGQDYQLYRIADDGAKIPQIWGKVLKMQPPALLITTFDIEPFEGRSTTLTWELLEAAGGTLLSLKHDGILEAAAEKANHMFQALDQGWDQHFITFRKAAG